jgi:hypothetical protein
VGVIGRLKWRRGGRPVVRDVGLRFLISVRLHRRVCRRGVVCRYQQARAELLVRPSTPGPRCACGSGGDHKSIAIIGS